MRISRELLDEMVAHAREEAPNECCGMVAARDGRAERVYRAQNTEASPLRFNIDGREIFRVVEEIEGAGAQLGAIYHSHTRSEPYPSQTDIGVALVDGRGEQWWPGTLYLIVGLAGEEPDVRAWDIRPGGDVQEVALEVE
ncbi:MAG: [CysO sulfur-carrier protein]-S-L-cysteine hydrolase [Solirubrobacteraceae bacterium]|nr:[CysO sulfur-carrier protein]-S-L-cysteine hydrolase [Solirubrobacteraceae bacterium]MDX6669640.1 [CysO sulfur-carrier protein]-S-L-cysteine hydrolase [Solirubrobacteraceae bacterium]